MRGVLANRRRTADTPDLAAQGQSVSRKTVAEVPLTGLSLIPPTAGISISANLFRLVRLTVLVGRPIPVTSCETKKSEV
jgi:hypothetical protein